MAKRSIVHIEIPADNPQAAGSFYGELFGWDANYDQGMDYVLFMSGNTAGGFPKLDQQMYRPGAVLLYIESEDIDADLRSIESKGGRTVMGKTEIPNTGYFAVFTDPTGNQMGLFTPNPRQA